MKTIRYAMLFVLIGLFSVFAQSATVTIGSVTTAVVGSTVSVPVTVTNFSDIGAISLSIQFDSNVLTCLGGANINSQIANALVNTRDNKITIGWYSTTPANISSGRLLDLVFTYKGGASNINFVQNECEIAASNLSPLSGVGYANGLISNGASNPVPDQPILVSPSNGATGVAQNTSLSWNPSSLAVSYSLQVSLTVDFVSPVINAINITSTSFQVSNLLPNTNYFWRVKAINSTGSSLYSSVWSFITTGNGGGITPDVPLLINPSNGLTGVPVITSVAWSPANNATTYTLQVSTTPTFSTYVVNQSNIPATYYGLPTLNAYTTYYWRVSASNSIGTSSYSAIFSFTTIANFKLTGVVTYDNANSTPLPNVTILLTSKTTGTVRTVTTNSAGEYSLEGISAGSYSFTASKTGGSGGYNAADALFISRYFSGLETFSLLQVCAADVNNNYTVNSNDALLILQRYNSLINAFPNSKTEWVFKSESVANLRDFTYDETLSGPETITFSVSDINLNVKGLCTGDANKSFVPTALK